MCLVGLLDCVFFRPMAHGGLGRLGSLRVFTFVSGRQGRNSDARMSEEVQEVVLWAKETEHDVPSRQANDRP